MGQGLAALRRSSTILPVAATFVKRKAPATRGVFYRERTAIAQHSNCDIVRHRVGQIGNQQGPLARLSAELPGSEIGRGELPVWSAKPSRPAHDSKVFTVRHVLCPIAGAHLGKRSNASGIRAAGNCPCIQLTVVASETPRLKVTKGFVCFTV